MKATGVVAQLPRKLGRQLRRQQLIDATIECLAQRGYAQVTLTDVARIAGVSHGLLNFHFETKEKLLAETLVFLADEYRGNWKAALAAVPATPAHQLAALIAADFNETVCTQTKLIAWCAFWGEAQSRPVYQEKCGNNDAQYAAMLEDICGRLAAEAGYALDPRWPARVIRVLMDGLWQDGLSMTAPYPRAAALETAFACAAAFFPRHFDERGLRDSAA